MRTYFLAIAVVAWLGSSAPVVADEAAIRPVVFYAMGDVPYGEADDVLLPTQVAELPEDAEFVVHVGDIKTGATHCTEPVYRKVSGMLAKSRFPTFIIPGDNEWNDCVDPASAWLFWENTFCGLSSVGSTGCLCSGS